MSDHSKIEWTDATWNPVTGCTRVSEGCRNCYMARTVPRFGQDPWKVVLHPDRLDQPLHWKKPRRIFVNSLSDLFHEDVPFEFVTAIFGVMAASPLHTFQVLTKRPDRMRAWCSFACIGAGPLHNVWLGVSIENQATADERIPLLLQTPAAVKFLSCEPLLGPINLEMALEPFHSHDPMLDRNPAPVQWTIVGGESGPGARPCDVAWIRSIRDQCQAAAVPCFIKQLGAKPYDLTQALSEQECIDSMVTRMHDHITNRKGGDPSEWPEDLRVREWPNEEGEG